MDISDVLGLPFPEGDDPQAIALYMQDLAFKLEDLLTAIDAETDAFNARPCAYWTNLADSVPTNSSASVDWNLAAPLAYQGNVSQTGASDTRPRIPDNRSGLWLIGSSFPTLVATTPNVDTYRNLSVAADGIGVQYQTQSFMGPRNNVTSNVATGNPNMVFDQGLEPNNGSPGVPLNSQGMAWVAPGATIDPATGSVGTIGVSINSTNTSSGFTLAAGSGFLWAVWLGYGTQQIVTV
jgi:hypothetical protein